MSGDAIQVLLQEFDQNPNWSQEKINELAERLNVTQVKVYKWNWDKRNRMRNEFMTSPDMSLGTDQVGN